MNWRPPQTASKKPLVVCIDSACGRYRCTRITLREAVEYSAWERQDVGWIEANTMQALCDSGHTPGAELQMMRDGWSPLSLPLDTADEARAACERHAARRAPEQAGLEL